MQIKSQYDVTSHLLGYPLSKGQEKRNVGEDIEKRETLYTVGGNAN